MSKRYSNINQHYIPQFYLRNFANEKGGFYVFDYINTKQYPSSTKKECHDKYFYDIQTSVFKLLSNHNQNYDELVDDNIRLLNEHSTSSFLKFIKEVKDSTSEFSFPEEEREKLYNFIVIQLLRTPSYRNRLSYLNVPFCIKTGLSGDLGDEKTRDLIHNFLILGVLEKMYDQNYHFNDVYYQIFQHLIDEVLSLKDQLKKAQKLILLNKSSKEFVTSKHPVNVNWTNNPTANHKALFTSFDDKTPLTDLGDYLEIQTLYLPISSEIAFFISNREKHPELAPFHNRIGIIKEYNIDLLENLNFSTSYKDRNRTYSKSNSFSDILYFIENRINPKFNFRFEEHR